MTALHDCWLGCVLLYWLIQDESFGLILTLTEEHIGLDLILLFLFTPLIVCRIQQQTKVLGKGK